MANASLIVINLDRDADRLEHMRAQLDRLGLPFARYSAVRGAELPDALKSYFVQAGSGELALSVGEIGCYASHLGVLQRVAAGAVQAPALVMEDDLSIPDDLPALLEEVLAKAPPGWDIIRLSNPPKRAYAAVAKLTGDRRLVRYSIVPGSGGAYLISASGAAKFLANKSRLLPFDQDVRYPWAWDLDTYGVAPMPIVPDVLGRSSIDSMAPKNLRADRRQKAKRRLGRPSFAARHPWNIRMMGLGRWLGAEAVNFTLALTPRAQRAALLQRAGDWLAWPDAPSR